MSPMVNASLSSNSTMTKVDSLVQPFMTNDVQDTLTAKNEHVLLANLFSLS